MRNRAREAFEAPENVLPEVLANLTYDQHRAIRFRPDRAPWKSEGLEYQIQAFHPGWLFDHPVDLFEVIDGTVVPLAFTGADFEYGKPLNPETFKNVTLPGVAGFRLHYPLNKPDYFDELIVFLGASYFRSLGKGNVYGLSARGLAVNTAVGREEEFPRFSRFYLQRPEPGQQELTIWAELDSPSVTGAFEFVINPDVNTQVLVDARLFLRQDVERLGIAPLTSMYLFGENDRTGFDDYRPEVHDSDALLILRENGERLWRPLSNPGKLGLSFFGESNPKGFGLLQRDRRFSSYEDTEAHYHKRPSLWIEPLSDWGKGNIMLAEIPSDKEINDNIAAFWIPDGAAEAGAEFRFTYRMTWGAEPEPGTDKAIVVGTRSGHGGTAASDVNTAERKFVVEFSGEQLGQIGADDPVVPDLTVQNGTIRTQLLQKLEGGSWRFIFDVERENGTTPVEMTLLLRLKDQALTERWIYQWNAEA